MPDALRQRAERILASKEGESSPSPPPALLDSITDELLVVASDTVKAVAAAAKAKPSGKAQLRLLAWVVADVRGADTLLDKAIAETVGKRLDRQAATVRNVRARAVEHAESARTAARSAAASSATELEALAAVLAAIDAEESAVLQRVRSEVYVGFHELDALLPGSTRYERPPAPPLPPSDHKEFLLCKDRPDGIFFPIYSAIHKYADQKLVDDGDPIPADLANFLGTDGTQLLWEMRGGKGLLGPDWWSEGIPYMVKSLMCDLAHEREWHTNYEAFYKEEEAKLQGRLQAAHQETKKAIEETEEAEAEIDELKEQLHKAKGRESALLDVIDRCRWGDDGPESSRKRQRE